MAWRLPAGFSPTLLAARARPALAPLLLRLMSGGAACAPGPGQVSQHRARVGAAVLRALAAASGPRALGLDGSALSLTEVRMSPDLRRAYVLWGCRPGAEERCERALARAAAPLRAAVARLVGLRHTPELHFRCGSGGAAAEERGRFDEAWARLDAEREAEEEEEGRPGARSGAPPPREAG